MLSEKSNDEGWMKMRGFFKSIAWLRKNWWVMMWPCYRMARTIASQYRNASKTKRILWKVQEIIVLTTSILTRLCVLQANLSESIFTLLNSQGSMIPFLLFIINVAMFFIGTVNINFGIAAVTENPKTLRDCRECAKIACMVGGALRIMIECARYIEPCRALFGGVLVLDYVLTWGMHLSFAFYVCAMLLFGVRCIFKMTATQFRQECSED